MYNIYNIQLSKLMQWLIPTMLRKPTLLAIVQAGYVPIISLHNQFIHFTNAKMYEIQNNYQTCYVQSFLNDRFDAINRGIYLDDSVTSETIYLYKRLETKPLFVHTRNENKPLYLYTRGESNGDMLNDFIVYVPASIAIDYFELRALIYSKICGKRYRIQNY